MAKEKVCIFTIDPQNDFCKPGGALWVPGADEDMDRMAAMIKKYKGEIDDIQITLDSHHKYHVAHPMAWIDKEGNHPDTSDVTKLTMIPLEDVEAEYNNEGKLINGNPKWKATIPYLRNRYVDYVKKLKENGRYVLVIWPEHCKIGFPGSNIYAPYREAMDEWEAQIAIAGKTTKGSNPHTEHYSAVMADVEDPEDPSTGLNTELINILKEYKILLSGEALSHCVASTGRDVLGQFSEEQIKRVILLEDATSNVPTFEKFGEDFINDMTAKGMQISKTTTFFK